MWLCDEQVLTFPSISTVYTGNKRGHWFIRGPRLHLVIGTFFGLALSTHERVCRCFNGGFVLVFISLNFLLD